MKKETVKKVKGTITWTMPKIIYIEARPMTIFTGAFVAIVFHDAIQLLARLVLSIFLK